MPSKLPNRSRNEHRRFFGLFSFAVLDQAILSAANFGVGLMLLRSTTDKDYGLYVMAFSTLLLISGAQGSLVAGPMAVLASKKPEQLRKEMVGGLFRAVLHTGLPLSLCSVLVFAGLGITGRLAGEVAILGVAASLTAAAMLPRDFLRQVMLLNSRPDNLLQCDGLFVTVLLAVAAIATLNLPPNAAPAVVLGIGIADIVAMALAVRLIRRNIGWARGSAISAFRETWRLGKWAVLGSTITWLHSQGFYYVLAAVLSVEAVAAVAAIRLLLMPVNLLVQGVAQQLLPIASGWYATLGYRALVVRGFSMGALLFGGALIYFTALWLVRDWAVGDLLSRQIEDQDLLLLLWGAVFGLITLRTASMIILQAIERFDLLLYITAATTTVSLLLGLWGIYTLGAPGALLGLIAGELLYLVAIVYFIARAASSDRLHSTNKDGGTKLVRDFSGD